MTHFEVSSEADFSDDEVAAAIAAVVQVLKKQRSQKSSRPVSNWRKASLLEGVFSPGQFERGAMGGNLWKASSIMKLMSVMALLFVGAPSFAQNATSSFTHDRMPPFAQDAMPAPAPDFRTEANAPALRPSIPEISTISSPPTSVRVALVLGAQSLNIGATDGALIKDAATGRVFAELPPQSRWSVSIAAPGGYNQLRFNGTICNAAASRVALIMRHKQYVDVAYTPNAPKNFEQPLVLNTMKPAFWLPAQSWKNAEPGRDYVFAPLDPNGVFSLNGKVYRGSLQIQCKATNKGVLLNAINNVDLEDYLLSVVPAEMPSRWPLEALKAQAIAARSYAVANLGKHAADGYDVKANTEDQVYSGVSSESEYTNKAIAETRALILRHEGKPVTAFFHSTSGGCTELSEHVFSKPLPFLKAVPDFDDESPHFSWTKNIAVSDIDTALRRTNRDVGGVLAMFPISRGNSPRVKAVLVAGKNKTLIFTGEQLRNALGLPSTNFNVGHAQNSYVFAGRGFGHGLGMSQWGARRLAADGYNAGQILSYYYKEITIEPI